MSSLRALAKAIVPLELQPRRIVDRLIAETLRGMTVRGGPFKGMRYTNEGYGVLAPKLFGTYECELLSVVEPLLKARFDRFVDIGAGDGYYVTGFAIRSRSREIVAYDASEMAQQMIPEMAVANGVGDRIRLEGWCHPQDLSRELRAGSNLVLMDVEGAEEELLDPAQVPELRDAWILFEAHDVITPGVGGRVVRRFMATHESIEIAARYREPEDITFLPQFYVKYIRYDLLGRLLERPDKPERMRWFYLSPKGKSLPI
jgi:hypothetical protein